MPLNADLYLKQMELARYCAQETCQQCRVDSFAEFIEKLKAQKQPAVLCPHWPPARVAAFLQAVNAAEYLPEVPSISVPRPAAPGLVELNDPDESSPLLVTGNSEFTQAVMLAVLSRTLSPMRLLSVDTLGHTVDMAMIYKTLTVQSIVSALAEAVSTQGLMSSRIILPGLAASLGPELSAALSRSVEIGPICAAELPLYMGESWVPAG